MKILEHNLFKQWNKMIKNVFIFSLLQMYVRGKNMISERGGGKNMIFNVIYRTLVVTHLVISL